MMNIRSSLEKILCTAVLGVGLLVGCQTPVKPILKQQAYQQKETEKKQTLEKILEEGTKYLQAKEYDNSIDSYKKALDLEPYNIQALNNMGNALASKKDYEEALKYFNKTLSIDPKRVSALNNKAQILYELGKKEEALTNFDKAIENAIDYVQKAMVIRNKNNILKKSKEQSSIPRTISWSNTRNFPITVLPPFNSPTDLNDDEKSYFPLTVGNGWTYIKTVNLKTGSYFGQVFEQDYEQQTEVVVLHDPFRAVLQTPRISEETYTVVDKTDDGFWKVKVEANIPFNIKYDNIFSEKENENVMDVQWGYFYTGVLEMRNGKLDKFPYSETLDQRWICILRQQEIVSTKPRLACLGALSSKEAITVPAGEFSDCLRSIAIINSINTEKRVDEVQRSLEKILTKNNIPESESLLVEETFTFGKELPLEYFLLLMGFRNEMYFAKNVGLIKEVQYNKRGEETYRLELKSYSIK